MARLVLTGFSDLHGMLLDDTDCLAAECRNAAIDAGGELWVESVCMHTRPRRQRPTSIGRGFTRKGYPHRLQMKATLGSL